jgi:mono/diheme cytochrome c family protein
MTAFKSLAVIIGLCLVAAIGFVATAWRSPIEPVPSPNTASFDRELVRRGAQLAAAGDCNTCHTAPGGRAFAGGRALPTPFGTIYSTNITPDADTGIGRWPEEAFQRALAEGVDREGRHLYPAFPYDHFTMLTRGDVSALYAFFMTREPVSATAPKNELPFPLNVRMLVSGWKLLFFRQGPYQPDAARSAEWNRGAFLAEGIAHCGACHTPRNRLGAEKTSERFSGGEIEGWNAYALNEVSPAPVPWDADSLRFYLRNGWHDAHGVARGPMAAVIDNLASTPDTDIQAIATYVASIAGPVSAERRQAGEALIAGAQNPASKSTPGTETSGEAIFHATCATCHESARPLPFGGVNLSLSTGPSGPNPNNMLNVVLWGLPPAEGARSPIMPGFAALLSDQQLAALLSYARARFSDKPAWVNLEGQIHDARNADRPATLYPAHGTDPARAMLDRGERP